MSIRRLWIAAFLFLFAQIAAAQTADEIVEKHLAAVGGRAALGKLKSRSAKGTISVTTPVGEFVGLIETANQEPNKARTYVQLDLSSVGLGSMVQDQRFDGTAGFVVDTVQGNREITGGQLENMKNSTFPTPLLNYKQSGATLELAGKEKVGDREAYVLVIKPKAGPAPRQYIDAESFLTIKTVVKLEVPQLGEVEQTTELSEFREVDGVKVPFKVKTISPIQTINVTLMQVQHNVPIDSALFSKPSTEK